jgi:hypothetical protein
VTVRTLTPTIGLDPAEPLWKRVPTHDDSGGLLSDFMMIIPKLRSRPQQRLHRTIAEIQRVLDAYHKAVVFADLNLKLNVLWVSVRPIPGICLELPAAIKMRVPEAMLVGQHFKQG